MTTVTACISPPPRTPTSKRYERALGDLLRDVPGAKLLAGGGDTRVTGVVQDSRVVQPGDLFVARAGARADGCRFVADAIARGACAVLVPEGSPVTFEGAARVEAPDVPRALAFAAAALYGHPTFTLDVIGVTGTNGKTTTTQLVRACVDRSGGRAGVIGTLGASFRDLELSSPHTSPEPDELARMAAEMLARGATHLVMEVSSIALVAARVDAVRFRVAAFTNLTQDHLDFHGTMEAYGAAKAKLFFDLAPGAAAVCVDGDFGQSLAERLARGAMRPGTTLARVSARPDASRDVEVAPERLEQTAAGTRIVARTPAGSVEIASPLIGAHNAENLLVALATAILADVDARAAAEALSQPIVVPGRLERCDTPGLDDVVVVVDYAHTPDALSRVLASVRPLTKGRVICVFGCGGDRDPHKRPLMGRAAGQGADVVIVTNDNPRSEPPGAIADAIVRGLREVGAKYVVELDRSWAIERAVLEAAPGDVVVVAGKGHEPYQILGDRTVAFDDRDEARRALDSRRIGPPTRRAGDF